MLKVQARDDQFPDHLISQTETLRPQEWSNLIRQCWHQVYLNQIVFPTQPMSSPLTLRFLIRLVILFLVPFPVLIRDDTIGKTLQNDSNGQV